MLLTDTYIPISPDDLRAWFHANTDQSHEGAWVRDQYDDELREVAKLIVEDDRVWAALQEAAKDAVQARWTITGRFPS